MIFLIIVLPTLMLVTNISLVFAAHVLSISNSEEEFRE